MDYRIIFKKTVSKNILLLLSIIFIDSITNSARVTLLPIMMENLQIKVFLLGKIMVFQKIVSFFITLPQASFIKRFGEKKSIFISILLNLLSYISYVTFKPFIILTGVFIEGLSDKLMNSSVSKSIYDETDGLNNRARIRAIFDSSGAMI